MDERDDEIDYGGGETKIKREEGESHKPRERGRERKGEGEGERYVHSANKREGKRGGSEAGGRLNEERADDETKRKRAGG